MNNNIVNSFLYQYQKKMEKRINKKSDGNITAVMFHQIEDEKSKWYDGRYAISFESFKRFLDDLQMEGISFVSPYEILQLDQRKKIVLTFDDVFDGIYYYVYPYLRLKKIPFVIFPAIKNMKEKGYINEQMLKEMTNNYADCFVGAHSFSHCNLSHLSREQCEYEIIASGNYLETLVEKKVDIFAYPFGDLTAVGLRERKIAEKRYGMAFGTLQAGVTENVDVFYIPRININEEKVQRKAYI